VRVILDTDPGSGIPAVDVDDGLALGFALRSPEVQLEAVTVVAGNVPVEEGMQSALAILNAAGAAHVPVHRGAARPLVQDPSAWRTALDPRRDGDDTRALWREVQVASHGLSPALASAAQALVEVVNENPGQITVLAIGPLTNIATAMTIDPEWASKVERVVVMGGCFNLPNVLHELNFAYDPEAAHVVLSSAAPLTIVPLDVTMRTALSLADIDRLDAAGTQLSSYLARTTRPWVRWLAGRFGWAGCPLHDPLAVAAVIDPTLVATSMACVAVELRGTLTRGRAVAWDAANPEALYAGLTVPQTRPVSIVHDVDHERFISLLLHRLST
jgi:inosine-uridine nucleoside N-ribohydrolase